MDYEEWKRNGLPRESPAEGHGSAAAAFAALLLRAVRQLCA